MRVVQFMHPGCEIDVVGNTVGWNTKEHCRRLLYHAGEYIDVNNNSYHNDNLCFWNEYEAPTRAYPTHRQHGWDYAKYYHQIIKPIQPSPNSQRNRHGNALSDCCDNTDPCVFGETFKYSNCQQVPGGDLWNLPPGSLILFGSLHAACFYLDTVFVTKDAGIKYSVPIAGHALPFVVSNTYKIVTLNNLQPRPNNRGKQKTIINEFMFYRGKLPKVNGNGRVDSNDIFSFTPARIFNAPDYNKRCKIDLAALNGMLQHVQGFRDFSPTLPRKHKKIVFNATQTDVDTIWHEVRDAVIKASFYLGYNFAW